MTATRVHRALAWLSILPLAFALAYAYAAWRLQRANATWASTGMSMDALLERFPRTEESSSARALDELVQPLGLERIYYDPRLPTRTGAKADAIALKAIATYATALTTLRDDARIPAPDVVDDYLRRHAADIATVEDYLSTAPPLVYAADLPSAPHDPVPPLSALRQLQTVLIVQAVLAGARGDAAGASRALDAAAHETAALTHRVDLLSQFMLLNFGEMRNGALRALREAPPEWSDLIDGAETRDGMLRAFQADAFRWHQIGQQYPALPDLTARFRLVGAARSFLTTPYARLSAAETAEGLRAGVTYAQGMDLCAVDADAMEGAMRAPVSWWNWIAAIGLPSLGRAWNATRDHVLSSELTRLVIGARAHRRAKGDWETGTVSSRVCASWSWVYERDGDRLRIRAAAAPAPGDKTERAWPFTLSATRP
jgi:hypothetical protein